MKNALNNQVGMLGDMFLWFVANLKQGIIYFIKQEGGNHKIAWVYLQFHADWTQVRSSQKADGTIKWVPTWLTKRTKKLKVVGHSDSKGLPSIVV